jgi:hypothetical protein
VWCPFFVVVVELGPPHDEEYVHTLNPSESSSGADGVATALPLVLTSWISLEELRPAGAPFTVARSNVAFERFGIDDSPAPPVPNTSGVSSIHSAVSCVEEYGTVCDHDCPVVRFCIDIVQTSEFGTASEIDAWMWLPGWTASDVMVTLGAGMSSHHAE